MFFSPFSAVRFFLTIPDMQGLRWEKPKADLRQLLTCWEMGNENNSSKFDPLELFAIVWNSDYAGDYGLWTLHCTCDAIT